MANNTEGQLVDLWNEEEESSGVKGWMEENISKKGIKKFIESTEKDLNEELFPGGKNIFGVEVSPFTQRDLSALVMGSIGGGPKSQASYILRKIQEARRGRILDDIGNYIDMKKMSDKWFKSREFDKIAKSSGIKFSPERRDPWAHKSGFKPWSGGRPRPGGRRATDPPKPEEYEW
tara:strand:- start:66 stop:593 length:528 start_codon:yes stop_codon:yes gene_type:complete